MRQKTFSEEGFEKHRKKTRREQFLEDMDQIVPWQELAAAIAPHYPQPKGAGRRPIGVERMLRIHFLQHWFNLSDPAVEEALYDSRAMRRFVGIDLGREPVPDETTICKFRHLLEARDLGARLFVLMQEYLQENGFRIGRGTIVDATLIAAPSSTKNQDNERDPEMRQTKKGNQWYFGMKAHIGTDSQSKLIHSVVATPANVHDSQVLGDLLHGDETRVWGDSAYAGQREAIRRHAPRAQDFTQRKAQRNRPLSEEERARNRTKSRVRAKGEHPLLVLKQIFGFRKVRYRGIHKNANRLFVACGLVNLYMVRRRMLALA
jgi:IS5 family transposase